jgi:hypothetical protein
MTDSAGLMLYDCALCRQAIDAAGSEEEREEQEALYSLLWSGDEGDALRHSLMLRKEEFAATCFYGVVSRVLGHPLSS